MQLKLTKYIRAGVREYRVINPDKKAVLQYDLEHIEFLKAVLQYDLEHIEFSKLYSFEDTVPVKIWEGRCSIDMKEMMETLIYFGAD